MSLREEIVLSLREEILRRTVARGSDKTGPGGAYRVKIAADRVKIAAAPERNGTEPGKKTAPARALASRVLPFLFPIRARGSVLLAACWS